MFDAPEAAAIVQLVHRHMPAAAVASGLASAVDPKPWVDRVCTLFRYVDRPEHLGLTALTKWLAERGLAAGEGFVRALRHQWIIDTLAVESRRHPQAVYFHAKTR